MITYLIYLLLNTMVKKNFDAIDINWLATIYSKSISLSNLLLNQLLGDVYFKNKCNIINIIVHELRNIILCIFIIRNEDDMPY